LILAAVRLVAAWSRWSIASARSVCAASSTSVGVTPAEPGVVGGP
jgi:hypothetical protein